MENIERFKKVRYYGSDGELTPDQIRAIGFTEDDYQSLEERAYQCAYDISNDWVKDNPDWDDVQEAFKRGVEESKEYYRNYPWHDASKEQPSKDGVRVLVTMTDYILPSLCFYDKQKDRYLISHTNQINAYPKYWCYLEDILPIE